jgi:hypothetical protein
MYYYVVCGTRADTGIEETVRTFDVNMGLTDQEARIAAMEHELIVRRDPKYTKCRVFRKSSNFDRLISRLLS